MKALSVQLPWAFAIVYLGKRIENRTRGTQHRGPMAIHATKPRSRRAYALDAAAIAGIIGRQIPPCEEMVATYAGHIVGVGELQDCRHPLEMEASTDPWYQAGSVAWMLDHVVATDSPIVLGRLGLWHVDDTLITYGKGGTPDA